MKKHITIIWLSFIIAGCTQVSSTYLRLSVSSPKIENIKRVAIFPFTDYSYNFDRSLRWLFNRRVIEALTDEFIKQGIQVAIQEDVEGLLVAQGIVTAQRQNLDIEEIRGEVKTNFGNISVVSPEYEVKFRDYSEGMRQEIEKLVQEKRLVVFREAINELEERLTLSKELSPEGFTKSLSEAKIRELGQNLGVDAIVRGRITTGKKNDSSFLIRVYLQNVRTGQTFWSGGIKIECRFFPLIRSQNSSFFDKAIRRGVSSLVKELFKERTTEEELIAFSSSRPFKLSLREIKAK